MSKKNTLENKQARRALRSTQEHAYPSYYTVVVNGSYSKLVGLKVDKVNSDYARVMSAYHTQRTLGMLGFKTAMVPEAEVL